VIVDKGNELRLINTGYGRAFWWETPIGSGRPALLWHIPAVLGY